MNNSNDTEQDAVTGLYVYPGHLVRRLHQISVGMFHDMLSEFNITPVQFGLLYRLSEVDEIDQRTLGSQIGVNAATISDVTLRLENRGLLTRKESEQDRRVKLLSITAEGVDFVQTTIPPVKDMQGVLLEPLTPSESEEFIRLASKIIDGNNNYSRAPIVRNK